MYRYEDTHGNGPYGVQPSKALRIMQDMHNGIWAEGRKAKSEVHRRWPRPPYIGLPFARDSDSLRCALISLDALARWFTGWDYALQQAGYKVVEYQVSGIKGKEDEVGQVVFSVHNVLSKKYILLNTDSQSLL